MHSILVHVLDELCADEKEKIKVVLLATRKARGIDETPFICHILGSTDLLANSNICYQPYPKSN